MPWPAKSWRRVSRRWLDPADVWSGGHCPDGQLLRAVMAQRVFADPLARQQLEAITHPRIQELWREQVAAWRARERRWASWPSRCSLKSGRRKNLTRCFAWPAATTQRQRLLARGWSEEQIQQRIAAQWPIERKMERADYVVWNEGELTGLAVQLEHILRLMPCAGGEAAAPGG